MAKTMPIQPYADNQEFLTALMEWLRQVVTERIQQGRLSWDEVEDDDDLPSSTGLRLSAHQSASNSAALFRQWKRRIEAGRAAGFVPPLIAMGDEAGIDDFEYKLIAVPLATALGMEFPIHRATPMGRHLRGKADLEVDVRYLLKLFCDSVDERIRARRYFHPDQAVFAKRILALEDRDYTTENAFLLIDIELPRRVFSAILGEDGMDDSMSAYARLISPVVSMEDIVLAPHLLDKAESIVRATADLDGTLAAWTHSQGLPYGKAITTLLTGPAGTGKTFLAHGLARKLGKRLLHVNYGRLDAQPGINNPFDTVLREAWLQDAIPFFDECEALFDRGGRMNSDFLTAIEYHQGLVLFATNDWVHLDAAFERRILYHIKFESPDAKMRRRIWERHLPPVQERGDDIDVDELALTYELNGGGIKNAVLLAMQSALPRPLADRKLRQADLRIAAQAQLRASNNMADQIEPRITLEQVILPGGLRDQVEEIIGATRVSGGVFSDWGFDDTISRGKGITVLFRGEPGTGKTLSAEAIAHALGRTLHKVNIAAINSMWVGQSEKNIRELFRQARGSASVLLFDEADSMFGKRIENPGSATDRYANADSNVLLQEIEEFEGLVILTTNLATNLDAAFERRLTYRLDFPLPERKGRAEIWRSLIPESCPLLEDIDYDALAARFDLAGGFIKNAVLRAARLAMTRGQKGLTNEDLWYAAGLEAGSVAGKQGRPVGFAAN